MSFAVLTSSSPIHTLSVHGDGWGAFGGLDGLYSIRRVGPFCMVLARSSGGDSAGDAGFVVVVLVVLFLEKEDLYRGIPYVLLLRFCS
jgi:hypothetical protein